MQAKLPEKKDATIGYFTVVEEEQTGWTGGLLTLDRAGRPLEFQCTLPVRPTRAHEILYGPTLRSHLIAEVIGPTLLKKSRTPLSILCVDLPESVGVEPSADAPVALSSIVSADNTPAGGGVQSDPPQGNEVVDIAGASFLVAMENVGHVRALAPMYDDLPDPIEPFERIREAIKEAQSQLSRQNSDAA